MDPMALQRLLQQRPPQANPAVGSGMTQGANPFGHGSSTGQFGIVGGGNGQGGPSSAGGQGLQGPPPMNPLSQLGHPNQFPGPSGGFWGGSFPPGNALGNMLQNPGGTQLTQFPAIQGMNSGVNSGMTQAPNPFGPGNSNGQTQIDSGQNSGGPSSLGGMAPNQPQSMNDMGAKLMPPSYNLGHPNPPAVGGMAQAMGGSGNMTAQIKPQVPPGVPSDAARMGRPSVAPPVARATPPGRQKVTARPMPAGVPSATSTLPPAPDSPAFAANKPDPTFSHDDSKKKLGRRPIEA